ncbi:MAG: recombinase family protein [Thermoplasmata archaeon]|nr:recombinase family protein [Thermoplasmata archaeon]
MSGQKVAIYVRVSTKEQAENNWSLEGQVKECREYCDAHDWSVVRLYKDKGYSASTLERPMLTKMLEHATLGLFERVVLWKYDRLSRDNMDFPALLHFFNKQDVEVCSVREPTPNDGSPYNEFIIGILGLVSSLERRVLMMRMDMGYKVRLEKGFHKGSSIPLGYWYNKDTGYLEIDEEEAVVVGLMFSKYLELGSVCAVKNWLMRNDVPTKRGGFWYVSTVRQMLGNRTYLGEYCCKSIKSIHPEARIIEDWVFDEVQRLLKLNEDKSPKRWNGVKLNEHKGQISFENDDPALTEYLSYKADMPLCPRCGHSVAVSKWGYIVSPTWGKLQKYACKKCNHQFTPHPDKTKKIVDSCPVCNSKEYVKRSGWGKRVSGERFQQFFCRACRRTFRGEYKEVDGITPAII